MKPSAASAAKSTSPIHWFPFLRLTLSLFAIGNFLFGVQGAPPVVQILAPSDHAVVNTLTDVPFTCAATADAGLERLDLYTRIPDSETTLTFSGKSWIQDAQISADYPDTNYGADPTVNIDGEAPHNHALLKIANLIGSEPGQIPQGALIVSAFLQLNCTDIGDTMQLFQLTEDWDETAVTWNQRVAGIGWISPGAETGSHAGVAISGSMSSTGWRGFNITSFVQNWASGDPNFGLVMIDGGGDGVDFDTSETANSPVLTVVYRENGNLLSFSGDAWIQDTQIQDGAAFTGNELSINVDSINPHAHALIKVSNIIGSNLDQIPQGAWIESAILQVYCTNEGNSTQLYRLTQDWSESGATWSESGTGLPWAAAGAEGASHAEMAIPAAGNLDWISIDITPFVQDWANGLPNFGLVMTDGGDDGIDFDTSESANSPVLTVIYRENAWEWEDSITLTGETSVQADLFADFSEPGAYFWNCLATDTLGQSAWAQPSRKVYVDPLYPDKPILLSPMDGTTGIDPSTLLQAEVNDPQGDNLEVTFWGTMPASADPFAVVVLPDTQKYFYTDDGTASLFEQQLQWIIQNREAMNIVFVSHEGDIVDTVTDSSMWMESDRIFNLLDAADIPYGLLPGNHDMVVNYPNHDLTAYNTYFPAARYSDKPWYGGCFDGSNANNYQIIQASGQDLLFMHLEFWPSTDASRDVIAWADAVINAHPNHKVLITTHGYLDTTAARNVHVIGSTEYLWEELVLPNPNVYFVLCGHVHGEARRSDTVIDSDGSVRQVHQLLADYQTLDLGGLGWLRIMTFVPREDQVYVETYSPYLDAYQTDADSQFILDLPMGLGAGPIGTTQSEIPGIGSSVSVTWSGLEPASEYFWWVEATDPTLRTRMSDVWSFTTTAGPPPAAPSDLTAIAASSTAIQLAWTDNAINETGFRVEQSIDGSLFTPIATLGADSTSTAVDGLTPESTYFFRVCAFHSDAGSAFSNTASATTPAANRPPTALNQTVSCQEDAGIQIALAASDPDQAPLALTYSIIAPPVNGYASQPNGAVVTYTPNNDFNGADSFSFVAFDGEDYSEPATITLDVAPINDAPVAQDDSAETLMGTGITISPLSNDTDIDGDLLLIDAVTQSVNGVVTLNPDQTSITYIPNSSFVGPDTIAYSVTDGALPSTAYIVVMVNKPTLFYDGFESGDLLTGGWIPESIASATTSAAFLGAYGAELKKTASLTKSLDCGGVKQVQFNYQRKVSGLANGEYFKVEYSLDGTTWIQVEATSGTSDWNQGSVMIEGISGLLQFRFSINGNAGNDIAAIDEVEVVAFTSNTAPVTAADAFTTAEDTILSVTAPGILGNDSDPDGDPITATLSQAPINGTLDLNPDGSFTYTPMPDFSGADTFSYTATDGTAVSSETNVSIEVTAVNDPPNALDDAYSLDEGATLTLPAPGILANDSDADGDTIIASLSQAPTNGTLSFNPDGSFTYTPADGFTGTDAFTYAVNDGELDSTTATVTLVVTPVATGGTLHVASIQVVALDLGKGLKQGYAEVVIVDSSGNPIEGAIVTGTFTEDITETQQSTTGTDGMAVFQTTTLASGRCHLTFTVDSVNLDGWLYDPTANVETSDINY